MNLIDLTSIVIPSLVGAVGTFAGYLQGKKKTNADLMSQYQSMYDVFIQDSKQQYVDMKKYFEKRIESLEDALEECKKSKK